MSRTDPVRRMLKDRGAGRHVVEGGIEYLLKRWRTTVGQVERGYSLTRDDYLNDMDTRQLLHESLAVATDRQKRAVQQELDALDARFTAATRPAKRCIWGAGAQRDWSATVNWWYYRLPVHGADITGTAP